MSYKAMSLMSGNAELQARITMCAVQEGKPEILSQPFFWERIATEPGWAAAWVYALANDVEEVGNDEAVITDGMILAAVQPWPTEAPAEGE